MGLWVLNQPDPYYILPILSALTTYIQSRMTLSDPSQKAMLFVMPIMIGIFSLSFPRGWLSIGLPATCLASCSRHG